MVLAEGLCGPIKMMIRTAAITVLPQLSIPLKVVDWAGIRIPFVEVPDVRSAIGWRTVFSLLVHMRSSEQETPADMDSAGVFRESIMVPRGIQRTVTHRWCPRP